MKAIKLNDANLSDRVLCFDARADLRAELSSCVSSHFVTGQRVSDEIGRVIAGILTKE